MLNLILLACALLVATQLVRTINGYIVNIRAARASGLKYVIVPVFVFSRWWMTLFALVYPLLEKLPKSWTQPWLTLLHPEWAWLHQYEPFREMGVDTFMTVSGRLNCVWTADPSVISQVSTRRNDFPKPIHMYGLVELFGKNVVSTEGQEWRHHRKITAPPFGEKNNALVWDETIAQTQDMLETWFGKDGKGGFTVDRIMDDTMRLSLHIISEAGFGRNMKWPENEVAATEVDEGDGSKIGNSGGGEGHTMSYTFALHHLLEMILAVLLLPGWLLKYFPKKAVRRGHEAHKEFAKYLDEMLVEKKAQIKADPESGGIDLLATMVRNSADNAKPVKSANGGAVAPKKGLTDDEIRGNAFVFILAGHETTANAIHFAVLFLAMYPEAQKELQADLDSIFGNRPPSQWDYATDLPKLFGGMAGAVMNEELRLMAPVLNISKRTPTTQTLTVDGKQVTLAPDTYISFVSPAVHRNPKVWPHSAPPDPEHLAHPTANTTNDLHDFVPKRWLLDPNQTKANGHSNGAPNTASEAMNETDDLAINTAPDTSPLLFTPPRGSYIPFSEGHRSCLGRRFAQIEIMLAIALIFREHSVEFDVGKWVSDEEVAGMDEAAKQEVWGKARDRCRWLMNFGAGQIITLQIRQGHVPVRFVRRGEERFSVGK